MKQKVQSKKHLFDLSKIFYFKLDIFNLKDINFFYIFERMKIKLSIKKLIIQNNKR